MSDDLFDWKPPPGYPEEPGFKEPTTSKDAAKAAGITACQMRNDLLTLYRAIWPAGMTADEAATKIGRNVLSVRPRISELRKLGDLFPKLQDESQNGLNARVLRRPNSSGLMATVLVCKKPTEQS